MSFFEKKIKVMKREAWASQTTATSSFVCWPCTMPVSRHSYEEPNFTIEDEGRAIRWEELDADMHISNFYETSEPNEQNEVAVMFKRCPWLNVSEVARAIGINKSLLARYIYGISKPSEQRVMQIRQAFHQFARELQTV